MRLHELLAFFALIVFLGCSNPESGPDASAGAPALEFAQAAGLPSKEMAEPGDTSLSADTDSEYGAVLSRFSAPFTGDLDEMRQRRVIRVLASHSQSNFFYDGGHPRGFEVELWREFEEFLNEGSGLESEVRIVFIPTPFGRLLTDLQAGRGDVAAAGLTVTPERRAQVAFSDPYLSDIHEVVVGNRSLAGLEDMEDLSGRTVFVTAGSSYVEHLHDLSRKLAETGLPAVEVVEAAPELVIEDLLEMVHAGILDFTVADAHIARAWAEVMPELRVREDLVVHRGGSIGWAVRRENPELRTILNAFVRQNRKGTLLGNILFKRYFGQSRWIGNPISEAERSKLAEGAALFQKYAARYDLDWLALAAQAYQESGLDQGRRSAAGAIGLMQLLPSTAAGASVGIPDISTLENNIHAGAKYLAFLRDRYFSDPEIDPKARLDFAWAAYNAGPARIRQLRRKAGERGFDPNRWFHHVEAIAAEEIGRETVDYVANVNKYYIAYRLGFEAERRRLAAMESASN